MQFGVIHGILKRVHEWPVVRGAEDIAHIAADCGLHGEAAEALAYCLQTRQCLDALCVALRLAREKVLRLLQPHVASGKCFIIWKP